MEQTACDYKHNVIDKRLDNHEERLGKLEISQKETNTRMDNICDRLDKLIDALYDIIKSMVGGIIVLGIGFIVWYIQKG